MKEHINNIVPTTVPGTDPGSQYTVIGRSRTGYVAIRRLSKYTYRLRCARFDGEPLLTVDSQDLITALTKNSIKIGENGKYLSYFSYSAKNAMAAVGTMLSVLLITEPQPDTYLEPGTDADMLDIDKQIDAEKAKAALKGASSEINVPAEPGDLKN